MKKKRRRYKPNAIIEHHITYDPPLTVFVYNGEHMVLTHLQRRTKNISKGLIEALEIWIEGNRHRARRLTKK